MSYKLRSAKKTERKSYSLSARSRKKPNKFDPCTQDEEKVQEKKLKDLMNLHFQGPIKGDETYEYRYLKNGSNFKYTLKSVKEEFGKGYSCRKTNVKKIMRDMDMVGSKHCLYTFKCRKYQDGPLMVKIGRTSKSDTRFSDYKTKGVEVIGNIHYWMIL